MAYKGMGQIDKKELWTIPNIITYFRILCIPAYIVLMAFAGLRADAVLLYVALGVFAVAAASDLVDGWIARRFNMTSGIGMALVFGVSVCLYSQFWPETLTGIFTKDAAVVEMAAGYLRGYSIDCIIVSFVFCINSYFSGQGNSWFPMTHSMIATFLFRIPLSYLFGQLDSTDLQLMGYAPPLSTMVSLLICFWYLRRNKRKYERLTAIADKG